MLRHMLTGVIPRLTGYGWSSSSPLGLSPDERSPVYPGRPIRPLPKRTIRSRLSPEQADSISYPLAPCSSNSLFNFPYSEEGSSVRRDQDPYRSGKLPGLEHVARHEHHTCDCGKDHSDQESEEEPEGGFNPRRRTSLPKAGDLNRSYGPQRRTPSSIAKPPPLISASSSVDGYESFENTNNKKKRKSLGNVGGHHSRLSPEMASMGISSTADDAADDRNGTGQYYGSGASAGTASGTGISGAGRGRYGRSSGRAPTERRPLGTSTNGLNAYGNGTPGKSRRDWPYNSTATSKGMRLLFRWRIDLLTYLQAFTMSKASFPRLLPMQRNRDPSHR